MGRRGAPGVWLPPAKFRNGIWGVSHGHPALRKRCGECGTGDGAGGGVRPGDPSVSLRLTAPVAVPKILCSLVAHRILTAATRSPRCICPRQRSARSPLPQGSLGPAGDESASGGPMGVLAPTEGVDAGGQKSVRWGGRFSRKADLPSSLSWVAKLRPRDTASMARPLWRSVSMPLLMRSLARVTA